MPLPLHGVSQIRAFRCKDISGSRKKWRKTPLMYIPGGTLHIPFRQHVRRKNKNMPLKESHSRFVISSSIVFSSSLIFKKSPWTGIYENTLFRPGSITRFPLTNGLPLLFSPLAKNCKNTPVLLLRFQNRHFSLFSNNYLNYRSIPFQDDRVLEYF